MLRSLQQDRGASFIEYAAVIVLAASIVLATVTAGFLTQISDLSARAIGCVLSSTGCDERTDDFPADADRNGDGSGTPVNEETLRYNAAEENEPPRESYECGWFQRTCDWVQGGVSEAADVAVDVWDGARGTACLFHLCTNEEFRGTWGGFRDSAIQLFTDPLGAAEDTFNEWSDGPQEDYANGYEDRSAGRTVVLFASSVFGFGLSRHLPNIPQSESSRHYRNSAEEAAANGDASSAQRHADDAEQAAEESERAAEANPDDYDLQEKAERDRADANAAARAVPVAEAREILISTPSGRELNRILNEKGVTIEFDDLGGGHHGLFSVTGNTITIDISHAGDPRAAIILAHEAIHADKQSGLPTAQQTNRDDYIDAHLEDETNARIQEYQFSDELREQGHDIPRDSLERTYNAFYQNTLGDLEDSGLSEAEMEARARETAAQKFTEELEETQFADGQNYAQQFGEEWDMYNN